MTVYIYKMLYTLLAAALKLCDKVFEAFQYLSGIRNINIKGSEPTNLVKIFLLNSNIIKLYKHIALLSVVIAVFFALVALIKNIKSSNRSQIKVLKNFVVSTFSTIFTVSLILFIVFVVGKITSLTLSSISISAEKSIGNVIINNFADTSSEIDLYAHNADSVIGKYKENKILNFIENKNIVIKEGLLREPFKFPFLLAGLTVAILTICLMKAAMTLVIRLYNIVFIFLIMPFSVSLYSYDGGDSFKKWREELIEKLIQAYVIVLTIYIYLILTSQVVSKLEIPGNSQISMYIKTLLTTGGALTINISQRFIFKLIGISSEPQSLSLLPSIPGNIFSRRKIKGSMKSKNKSKEKETKNLTQKEQTNKREGQYYTNSYRRKSFMRPPYNGESGKEKNKEQTNKVSMKMPYGVSNKQDNKEDNQKINEVLSIVKKNSKKLNKIKSEGEKK